MEKSGSEKNSGDSAAATATSSNTTNSSAPAAAANAAAKETKSAEGASSAAASKDEKQAPAKETAGQKLPQKSESPAEKERQPPGAAGTPPRQDAADGKKELQREAPPEKAQAAAKEADKKKPADESAEKQPQEKKDVQVKKASEKETSSKGVSSASKESPQHKLYGDIPPPSFMLSEIIQEDIMFSEFHYVALTECDGRVYGYGTLSANSTDPQGEEGVVDFDPGTNRFHLIYCTQFALEVQSTAAESSSGDRSSGGQTSPGCRQRATLAARRIKDDLSSCAEANVEEESGSAAGGKHGGKGRKSSQGVPWRLLLFGGFDQKVGDVTNDVWEFRLPPRLSTATLLSLPSVGSWRELPVTGAKPPPRGDHAVCVSAEQTQMFVFGGTGRNDTLLNDCYLLTENNKWVLLSAGSSGAARSSAVPAPRRCHTLVCGSSASKEATLYLFGGDLTTRGREASNDLWKYSLQQKRWTCITLAAGRPPTARYDHASAFNSNKVWIGGGLAPGWLGPTELKDLFGFDVIALYWFQCVISLGKVQQPLPRFRPLAFIPATRSFFIFGCSQHRHYQQTQAAVCSLNPVCTMDNLVPLKGLNSRVKQGLLELAEDASGMGVALQGTEEKVSLLRQQVTELEAKREQLQQKLLVVAAKEKKLRDVVAKTLANTLNKKFEKIEKRCPSVEHFNKAFDRIESALGQIKTTMNTKGTAADVAFLADALEQIKNKDGKEPTAGAAKADGST